MAETSIKKMVRKHVPEPPTGFKKIKSLGPGLLWMISSVGSGSILFTPRIGSRYEYELLWIALIIIYFMYIMIKEVGRYTVVTGKTILDGYAKLPGPRGWAIWFIFIPQIVAAIVTIAGIAALTGSAIMIVFNGKLIWYAIALILFSILLVVSGRYKIVENASSVMSAALIVIALVTVAKIFPEAAKIGSGAIPKIPKDFDIEFTMP